MTFSRSALLVGALLVGLPAYAANHALRSRLLPEINEHLDTAREEMAARRTHLASAHADMVLIGDRLAYRVQFDEDVANRERMRCIDSLRRALDNWEEALDHTIEFVESDRADTPITIQFRPHVKMGHEPVAGYATWKRRIDLDGDRVFKARVTATLQIRTQNLNDKPMPAAAMTHEVMHEMGHVLGLEDRDRVGELMGPLNVRRPVANPSRQEANAVMDAREEAREIKLQALSRG
jgi:hypothetical protein